VGKSSGEGATMVLEKSCHLCLEAATMGVIDNPHAVVRATAWVRWSCARRSRSRSSGGLMMKT